MDRIIIKCLISKIRCTFAKYILIFFSHVNLAIKRKTLLLILKDNSFVQNRAGDSCDSFFWNVRVSFNAIIASGA